MTDLRDDIGTGLRGKLTPDQIDLLLNEILAIRKNAWGDFSCKACGQKQRQNVEIPDARAVTSALKDLADQAWGKPNDAPKEGTEFVVHRNVYLVGEDEGLADES